MLNRGTLGKGALRRGSISAPGRIMGGRKSAAFLPSDLDNLEAWYRFNTGITVEGAGVSVWADQSGNGNDLLQGTDTNRPSHEGDGTILFDGVDNYLQTANFTLVQPTTIYLLAKQIAWTTDRAFIDGNTANSGLIQQKVAEPQIRAFAGTGSSTSSDLALDTYGIIAVVFNGASSVFQVDDNTAITGNFGTTDMGGVSLGRQGNEGYIHGQIKEVIVYSAAHDADTRTQIRDYLNTL